MFSRHSNFLLILGVLLITSCVPVPLPDFSKLFPDDEPANAPAAAPKKNDTGIQKKYYEDGSLLSEVPYVNGKRHGIAKNFSESGVVLMEIPYKKGLKHGVAKAYYYSGGIKRETEYKQGRIDGDRKFYFKNGSLSAQLHYKNDWPATDLREHYKSGKEVKLPQPKVKVKNLTRTTGEFIVTLSFTEKVKRPDFFEGSLVEGKYFNETTLNRIPQYKDGVGTYTVVDADAKDKIDFVCTYKTKKGNTKVCPVSVRVGDY